MFELAELNETRVARELMNFVSQISDRMANPVKNGRIRIPTGKLRLGSNFPNRALKIYQAILYSRRNGTYRLEFEGMIGKEKFYLPANFLMLLQYGILHIQGNHLEQLAQRLNRLREYYRYKKIFGIVLL